MFANRMLVVLIGCLSLAACVAHDPHLTGAIEQPSASVIPQARMVAAAPSARAAVEVLAITTRRDSGAFNLTRERDDPTVISHIKDMLGLVPQQAIAQARE
jgi:hypothetical protein